VSKSEKSSLIPYQTIERSIVFLRGHKVILDQDLAPLYDVETKTLIRSVKRQRERFPDDFMFQLTGDEFKSFKVVRSHGGRRYPPYAFTELGIAMLSSVLNSPRAIQVNIEIMRAFVRLREVFSSHKELAQKLVELERKYDKQFKVVFDAIRALTMPPEPKSRPIGFSNDSDKLE
jgi:hypothetical protein